MPSASDRESNRLLPRHKLSERKFGMNCTEGFSLPCPRWRNCPYGLDDVLFILQRHPKVTSRADIHNSALTLQKIGELTEPVAYGCV